jgi:hypothetical protein
LLVPPETAGRTIGRSRHTVADCRAERKHGPARTVRQVIPDGRRARVHCDLNITCFGDNSATVRQNPCRKGSAGAESRPAAGASNQPAGQSPARPEHNRSTDKRPIW